MAMFLKNVPIVILFILFAFIAQATDIDKTIIVNGLKRQYLVHLPPGYTAAKQLPVIFALHGGGEAPTSVRDIAERTGLPQPYLEQILLALKGAGLVRSKRGVGGGYVLAREPETINLAQIVSAVDGPIVAGDFGQPHENGACDHEGQCILLSVWGEISDRIRGELQSLSLADMVARSRGLAPLG